MLAALSARPDKTGSLSKDRLGKLQKPWTAAEGLISLYLTITIPVAISLWLLAANRYDWLPPSVLGLLRSDSILATAVSLIIGLMVEFGLLYYFYRRYQLSIPSFGFKKFSVKKAALYILAFYAIFVVLVYLAYLFLTLLAPQLNLDEAQNVGFEFGKSGVGLILSWLATVVMAPIIEEIYFRGFLLPAFSKHSFLFGALISSLFFGLLHFQLNVAIYTFILGMFLAYMYYRLGSIVPGIILHMGNNLIAFLLLVR